MTKQELIYKLSVYYMAETELYDRTLTNLRSPYDQTEAFIDGSNRSGSQRYASFVWHDCIDNSFEVNEYMIGGTISSIYYHVRGTELRDCINQYRNRNAQWWIDEYNRMKNSGEYKFMEDKK